MLFKLKMALLLMVFWYKDFFGSLGLVNKNYTLGSRKEKLE
jgi:hypothetical protein